MKDRDEYVHFWMSGLSYHFYCCAWCISTLSDWYPTVDARDLDMANEAVRAGIVFG